MDMYVVLRDIWTCNIQGKPQLAFTRGNWLFVSGQFESMTYLSQDCVTKPEDLAYFITENTSGNFAVPMSALSEVVPEDIGDLRESSSTLWIVDLTVQIADVVELQNVCDPISETLPNRKVPLESLLQANFSVEDLQGHARDCIFEEKNGELSLLFHS